MCILMTKANSSYFVQTSHVERKGRWCINVEFKGAVLIGACQGSWGHLASLEYSIVYVMDTVKKKK